MAKLSFLLFLLSFGLGSCRFISDHRIIRIEVPSVPADLEESCRGVWILELSSTTGRSSQKELDWQDSPPGRMDVDWPKEEDLLILLTPPEWVEGLRPFPCGGYVPAEGMSEALAFVNGASVSVLSGIIRAGGDLKGFNCDRFMEEMASLDNPWLTDQELLTRQLGRREMRSWYIRASSLYSLQMMLPEGCWYHQSMILDPLSSEGPENPVSLNLPEGYTSLFNPFSRQVVEIQVDDHGEAVWMLSSSGSFQFMGPCPVPLR